MEQQFIDRVKEKTHVYYEDKMHTNQSCKESFIYLFKNLKSAENNEIRIFINTEHLEIVKRIWQESGFSKIFMSKLKIENLEGYSIIYINKYEEFFQNCIWLDIFYTTIKCVVFNQGYASFFDGLSKYISGKNSWGGAVEKYATLLKLSNKKINGLKNDDFTSGINSYYNSNRPIPETQNKKLRKILNENNSN